MSKDKDYIKDIDGAERRFFVAPVTIEKRAEEDENEFATIEGYAAMFNKRADLYWYEEEILPGAFDEVLNDDVRCLFNHNPNYILARSNNRKGTLSLSVDDRGLKYSYTTPDRSYARDLQNAIESGDVSQSSFAFLAKEVVWVTAENDDEKDLRQIKKMSRLLDVSPVTYPAYQDTEVAKRGLEEFKKEQKSIDQGDEKNTGNDVNKRALTRFEAQLTVNQNRLK